jgi:NADPH:quinone reductase-like Zn-dependent oxidoreductase
MHQCRSGAGEVLVRVRATGITPAELTWDASYQHADGTPRIPGIPGHEVSGVVGRSASDVTDFRPDGEVYGLTDLPRDGARVRGSSAGQTGVEAPQHLGQTGRSPAALTAGRGSSNMRASLLDKAR